MPIWRVCGGNTLNGSVRVQGAKNAVLPILAGCLVRGGVTVLENCPALLDVDASVEILRHLGCRVMQNGGEILVDSRTMSENRIPHSLMLKMRSSVTYMGAILARCGEVCLSAPGGCELGSRPIDLHLEALQALGAEVEQRGGEVLCRTTGLRGAHINLRFPSVGATENVMLAACAAEGTTVLTNAAMEPEIADLQEFLCGCGAEIHGAGSPEIYIEGMKPVPETRHRILPDRIAAASYLCAAAAAGGEICLSDTRPEQLATVLSALKEMGCGIVVDGEHIRLRRSGPLRAPRPVITRPYPGFPTDAQALLMAPCLKAEGTSVFVENIFDNRFRHCEEFARLGAEIRVEGRVAMISGVSRLTAAPMAATDLRGGAAMIAAALSAEGESSMIDSGHVARGYADLAPTLRALGADVRLENDPPEQTME